MHVLNRNWCAKAGLAAASIEELRKCTYENNSKYLQDLTLWIFYTKKNGDIFTKPEMSDYPEEATHD